MRIFEIDEQDRIYAAISDIDLDIDADIEVAKTLMELISESNNSQVANIWINELRSMIPNLEKIVSANFHNDSETASMKQKASYLLSHIRKFD